MDVLVVGGGLAGLTAADRLHRAGLSVTVVEARERVGGRLLTMTPEGLPDGAWIDLGATWHWSDQCEIEALGAELGLHAFPQFSEGRALLEETAGAEPARIETPAPQPAELRFAGGTQQLCTLLAERLPRESVVLGTSLTALSAAGTGLVATTVGPDGDTTDRECRAAVVAMPPRLALDRIDFSPPLPDDLVGVMRRTTTWMAQAIKCVAVYETPFWRDDGLSGFAYSHSGPLREVHDGCSHDGSVAALWGFLAGDDDVRTLEPRRRAESVLAHLERLFGPRAGAPVGYYERDWSADPNTIDDEWYWVDGEPLDYGHPALAELVLDGRVALAGTETAPVGGGHMEGAVRSGLRAASAVVEACRTCP